MAWQYTRLKWTEEKGNEIIEEFYDSLRRFVDFDDSIDEGSAWRLLNEILEVT